MNESRRLFFKRWGSLAAASLLIPGDLFSTNFEAKLASKSHYSPEKLAEDESFWREIRQAYECAPDIINLNNGAVSPHTRGVREAVGKLTWQANQSPSKYMARAMSRRLGSVKIKLAKLAGCEADEIALMRNTTEAIVTVLEGIDWKEDDEILTSDMAYPSVMSTLSQLRRRRGVKIKKISLPIPLKGDAYALEAFEKGITPHTRLLLFSHTIFYNGQFLPAKKLCKLAHTYNAEVLVDGAHSFAHKEFKISDLDCDYFATSLHKWLCAPYGNGMLYVKKEKIAKLWPLFAAPEDQEDKISKFQHLGTLSIPAQIGISYAIDFHNLIGTDRKAARLHYLKSYWVEKLKDIEGIRFYASPDFEHTGAIMTFSIEGIDNKVITRTLSLKNIITTTMKHPRMIGIRISPNIYNLTEELDIFIDVVKEICENMKK